MKTVRRFVVAGTMGLMAVGPMAPGAILTAGAQSSDGGSSDVGAIVGVRSTIQTGTTAVINWRTLPGADSYRIYVDDRSAITDDDGWLVIRGLNPLQTYSVQVAAVVGGVEGERSEAITLTTPDLELRAPGLLVDFGIYRLTSSLVPFAWDEFENTSIELYRDGVLLDPVGLGGSTARLLDRDVVPGTTYIYKARFISDATGVVGEFGPDIVVTVPGAAPGSGPDIEATFADFQVVVVRMDDLDVGAAYEVERNGVNIGVFSQNPFINTQWFADRTVSAFETYTYRVRSISPDGTPGEWSNETSETTSTPTPLAS